MTSEQLLILILGIVAGFALGWVTKWREDRKLEHHGVKLRDWDTPIDFAARRKPRHCRSRRIVRVHGNDF